MKKVLFALATILGISVAARAQQKAPMEMKDGVMMVNHVAILCQKGECTKLTHTYTCSNGCRISTDGTITKPDGTAMKLMNGYVMYRDGQMAMIPHGQKGHICTKDCPMYKQM